MKKLLALIALAPICAFAVANSSATVAAVSAPKVARAVESLPKAEPAAPIKDPCTPFKRQVEANFNQIQTYKATGEDGKIPALHSANVAIRNAHPQCFEE